MEYKIDIVYLWCDGNDPEFKSRKQLFSNEVEDNSTVEVIGDKRFLSNDELKYSLRSLEMYAPWINHVFIVTDRQKPEWLNTEYSKVTVVDHSEIMPKEMIPCFNSTVIEYFLGFIPGLSELFLYANDDMFFGRDVSIGDFFLNGKAIVKTKPIYRNKIKHNSLNRNGSLYIDIVLRSNELINKVYNKQYMVQSHHNIDAYIKSSFLETFHRFKNELNGCIYNKFRDRNDFQRILFNLDMICNNKAVLKMINDPPAWKRHFYYIFNNIWESYVSDDSINARREILKYRPLLFCLNASNDLSTANLDSMKIFLEKLYPYKSKFEK